MKSIPPSQYLRHIPLFAACSDAERDALAASVEERRYDKGQLLFQRGDACEGMHVQVVGRVKLVVASRAGQEKVVEIINPGQSFGEAVLFLGQPYPVMAQALEDSLVLFIPRQALDALLDADPRFARSMLAGLSVRLRGLLRDVESYSLQSAVERVVAYLLNELGEAESGSVWLPVNKQTLASRLNLTPETFSRLLQKLGDEAGVSVEGREVKVPSTTRLAGLLGEL